MADVRALKIGLSAPLSSGANVFGVLSEDGSCICYELTAPDGNVTRFALTDEALSMMLTIRARLHMDAAGAMASDGGKND